VNGDDSPPVNNQSTNGEAPRQPQRSRWRRIGLGISLVLGVLLIAVLAAVSWVVGTTTGTAWAARQAVQRVPALEVDAVVGTFASGLDMRGLRYSPPEGPLLTMQSARVELALGALLGGTVHVRQATADGVRVLLREAADKPDDDQPVSLDPPVDLLLDSVTVTDAVVADETASIANVNRASLRGRWTDAGIAVEELDVRAEQGVVQLTGHLGGGPEVFDAAAAGNFRWRAADRVYAGTLEVATEHRRTQVDARLTEPLDAQLTGSVEQTDELPWRVALEVPPFDPRRRLLPDTQIASLEAKLAGAGTGTTASLRGHVALNDQVVHLQSVRLARPDADLLLLESLVARLGEDSGELRASGRLDVGDEMPRGSLQARWTGIDVPEQFAGQPLRTRGELEISGSAAAYRATSTLAIGPPERMADVQIRAEGTSTRVRLEQFDVVQSQGRLAASGAFVLQPQRGWELRAEANSFDPGELLAGWSGDLDLTLATQGTLTDDGARGSLQLNELDGTLRGRPINGSGAVEFAPPLSLAGKLQLRSGASRLRIDAAPGRELDATAVFNVASLADFLPQARGKFDGRIRARGAWPDVQIDARATGAELHFAAASVAGLSVEAQLRNPTAPSGKFDMTAEGVAAGGFEFDELLAQASGAGDAHRVSVDASGERLVLGTRLTGSLAKDGAWRASVDRLRVDVPDGANLQLHAPVEFKYANGVASLSRACLADGAISLCAATDIEPDGSLQASYSLAEVPLALANALFPDALPGQLVGSLGGDGEVRRTSAGLWHGTAALTSAEARIEWGSDGPDALAGDTIVIYEDLRLQADLRGTAMQVQVDAVLGGDGTLQGEVAVAGLDEQAPAIRGQVAASLPTLAPLAPFVPQLAGLDGRIEADIALAGTVEEPAVSGAARAMDLSAEIPLLGIRLSDGRLQAETRTDGAMELSGAVKSGDTRLELTGTASRAGVVEVSIQGRRFLAANLPGARVLVTPDLRFARDADRMSLTGTVRIPEADVNLQRLPQARPEARAVSPDVVIVNEPPPEVEAPGEALPLHAEITVALGDGIEVTGFGLESTVAGQIIVREIPGRQTTASGEVRIDGTYRAYGQNLAITQGQVLYAGTPIDNPRLYIEAVREIDAVTAGLRITGPAQNPQIDVFSDPTLGETDALAYLVTGRPLNAIGTAGADDADLLQDASQSLGAAAGGLLAKSLGKRIGIDEVGVAESEVIGGAALTLGQYLSPRLYVGFGVGLFDPGQVVTVRYDISDDFSVEAVTGEDTTRAGIDYRVER
jgi:translocation and assembly module TamB